VHHVAFRTPDDAPVRSMGAAASMNSVSATAAPSTGFKFPAACISRAERHPVRDCTDGPGFATDEPMETLRERKLAAAAVLERAAPKSRPGLSRWGSACRVRAPDAAQRHKRFLTRVFDALWLLRSGALQTGDVQSADVWVRSRFCEAATKSAASRPGHQSAISNSNFYGLVPRTQRSAKRRAARAGAVQAPVSGTIPVLGSSTSCCIAPGKRGMQNHQIKISNSQALASSPPPAELGFLVDLPFLRETGRRKAHLGNGRACFPDCRKKQRHTATPLSVPPRASLRPWSVLPGTLAPGDFSALACPRPASSQWQNLSAGTGKPRASRVRACEARPLVAASAFGLPLRPALALPHFRTPLEAPSLDRTRAG